MVFSFAEMVVESYINIACWLGWARRGEPVAERHKKHKSTRAYENVEPPAATTCPTLLMRRQVPILCKYLGGRAVSFR